MNTSGNGNNDGPSPEQFSAYVDGELNPTDRAIVEGWLADHPDALAEIESLRGLAQVWQTTLPPEPNEEKWAAMLAGLRATVPEKPAPDRRWVWVLGSSAAAAAALLLAFFLWRPAAVVPPEPQPIPLPVVSADDVEIISLDMVDAPALVVGEPPVREPLAWLLPSEVTVDEVKNNMRGMNPWYARDGSTAPMIIMMPNGEDRP